MDCKGRRRFILYTCVRKAALPSHIYQPPPAYGLTLDTTLLIVMITERIYSQGDTAWRLL